MNDPQLDGPPPRAGWLTRLSRSPWPPALFVTLVALGCFGHRLGSEPHFVDESAYVSQSYYARLFLEGRFNDPAWLEYPAYDLPPVPKYLIGSALGLAGHRTPGRAQAFAWYRDTSLRFISDDALVAARVPTVLVGAAGCLALYALGVMYAGRGAGTLAALLLAFNPLYRMLARRAMSDVPCEAFTLVSLAFGLWAWRRWQEGRAGPTAWASLGSAGLSAGLALQCKMSGSLSIIVLAAWAVLGLACRPRLRSLAGVTMAGGLVALTAAGASAALNPFLTAHPTSSLAPGSAKLEQEGFVGRARMSAALRLDVASQQRIMFPHNAVNGPAQKVATVAAQGFGRFGPFGPAHTDSTRRFDSGQDRGALLWLPCVAAGLAVAVMRGRRERSAGVPAVGWAIAAQYFVTFAVVTAYLPLAWDRYFLSLQAPGSLLAAAVASELVGRVAGRRIASAPRG